MTTAYLAELGIPNDIFVQTSMLVPTPHMRESLLFAKVGAFLTAAGIHAGVQARILQHIKENPVEAITVLDGRFVLAGSCCIDSTNGDYISAFPDPELVLTCRLARVRSRIDSILQDRTS